MFDIAMSESTALELDELIETVVMLSNRLSDCARGEAAQIDVPSQAVGTDSSRTTHPDRSSTRIGTGTSTDSDTGSSTGTGSDSGEADRARIDLLAELERARAIVDAAQARVMVDFSDSQLADHVELGLPARSGKNGQPTRGRGIAMQIGLALKCSPAAASRRLGRARRLITELPHTFDRLAKGDVSEQTATVVNRGVAHLEPEQRTEVDRRLAGKLPHWSTRTAASAVMRQVQEVDPGGEAKRAARAATERRVTFRPAPVHPSADCSEPGLIGAEGMGLLSATLPAAHGSAVMKALDAAADAAAAKGDGRTRNQVRSDTLVERVTGQATATAVPVEVQLVMTDDALLAGGTAPAWLDGYGPLVAAAARAVVAGEELRPKVAHQAAGSQARPSSQPAATSQPRASSQPQTADRAHPPLSRQPRPSERSMSGHDPSDWRAALRSVVDDVVDDVANLAADNDMGPTLANDQSCDQDFGWLGSDDRRLRDSGSGGSWVTDEELFALVSGMVDRPTRERGQVWIRRLLTHPIDGTLIAADSRRRRFPDAIGRFITLRDRICRTPFCDAPIRHLDHLLRYADGGLSTSSNGNGRCERCNLDKEAPGWQHTLIDPGHTVECTWHPSDGREAGSREADSRETNGRETDSRETDSRETDGRETDSHQTDRREPDRRGVTGDQPTVVGGPRTSAGSSAPCREDGAPASSTADDASGSRSRHTGRAHRQAHRIRMVTPTGHAYDSQAYPVLGPGSTSEVPISEALISELPISAVPISEAPAWAMSLERFGPLATLEELLALQTQSLVEQELVRRLALAPTG